MDAVCLCARVPRCENARTCVCASACVRVLCHRHDRAVVTRRRRAWPRQFLLPDKKSSALQHNGIRYVFNGEQMHRIEVGLVARFDKTMCCASARDDVTDFVIVSRGGARRCPAGPFVWSTASWPDSNVHCAAQHKRRTN